MPTRRMEAARARQMRLKRELAHGQHTSPRRAYEQLRAGIRSGAMNADQLLADDGLARALGASRNSVRRALQMLADDGLVTRERRSGTTVRGPIFQVPAGEMVPRGAESPGVDPRGGPTVFVEELRSDLVPCPPDVRVRLSVDATSLFVYEQLGLLDNEPSYVRIGYVPIHEQPQALASVIEDLDQNLAPFEECFRAVFGAAFGGSRSAVEAVACPRRISHMLKVEEGSAVLLRELTLYDQGGVAREVSYTHFRGDRVALSSGAVVMRAEAS
jgi:GntR family transcriptional regulator